MRGDRKQEERIFDLFEIINSKVDIVDLLYALTKEDMDDLAEKLETTYNKLWPDKKVKRLKKPEEQKVSERFSLKTSEPRYNSAAQSTNSEHQNIQLSGAGYPSESDYLLGWNECLQCTVLFTVCDVFPVLYYRIYSVLHIFCSFVTPPRSPSTTRTPFLKDSFYGTEAVLDSWTISSCQNNIWLYDSYSLNKRFKL